MRAAEDDPWLAGVGVLDGCGLRARWVRLGFCVCENGIEQGVEGLGAKRGPPDTGRFGGGQVPAGRVLMAVLLCNPALRRPWLLHSCNK